MPRKMNLIFLQKSQPVNYHASLASAPAPAPTPLTPAPNGLNLRRIMNAPKTGCKSCGG